MHQPFPRPVTAGVKEAFKNAFTAHDTQTTRQRVECKSNARDDRQGHTLYFWDMQVKCLQRVNISIFFERVNFIGPTKDQKMTKNPTLISEAGPWGFEDAHARCHGDGKVNEALRSIMRWLTLSSFTTYPCILQKNGQYTACRGHFMLSNGIRFSSLVLRVFKRCQGKVGQFNTIWIGQVPSFVPMISGKSLPRPDGPTFYIWPCLGAPRICLNTPFSQTWSFLISVSVRLSQSTETARLACASTFALHAWHPWRGQWKILLKILAWQTQFSAIPLKSG